MAGENDTSKPSIDFESAYERVKRINENLRDVGVEIFMLMSQYEQPGMLQRENMWQYRALVATHHALGSNAADMWTLQRSLNREAHRQQKGKERE